MSAQDVDTDTDSDTDTDQESGRKVADHKLLDANGKFVKMELAEAVRYIDEDTKKALDCAWVDLPEHARKWYCFFGIKTLWTNEASQVRQAHRKAVGDKKAWCPGDPQIAAIKARHDLIVGGKFVDRTREAMVWEIPTLIEASVNIMVTNGDIDDTPEDRAKSVKSLTDKSAANPDQWRALMRGTEGVENEYRRLKGGAVKKASSALADALKG